MTITGKHAARSRKRGPLSTAAAVSALGVSMASGIPGPAASTIASPADTTTGSIPVYRDLPHHEIFPAVETSVPTKVAPVVPAPRRAKVSSISIPAVAQSSTKLDRLLAFLRAQDGKSYRWGGNGPRSYDCSGLVAAAFRAVGVSMPRIASDQAHMGSAVSMSDLQPGDLLFWGSPAYHVAVYLGSGKFISAENPSMGVVILPLSFDYPQYARRVEL